MGLSLVMVVGGEKDGHGGYCRDGARLKVQATAAGGAGGRGEN